MPPGEGADVKVKALRTFSEQELLVGADRNLYACHAHIKCQTALGNDPSHKGVKRVLEGSMVSSRSAFLAQHNQCQTERKGKR